MLRTDKKTTITFRTYIKPREYGSLQVKLWHSNVVDSTWADGKESQANDAGGCWRIESCFIADGGTAADGTIAAETQRRIRFNGSDSKEVEHGECFWSDDSTIELPEQHFLAFTWSITMYGSAEGTENGVPFNTETLLASAYEAEGDCSAQASADGFSPAGNRQVLPSLLAYKRTVSKKLVFLGDSITQGVRNELDGYTFWTAKIAEGLGADVGVWNIGSGWARAYDLVNSSAWLAKAKQGDEVAICIGVNDIGTANRSAEQIIADLTSIIGQLQEDAAARKLWLFTLPAFNFTGEQEFVWRTVNNWIREQTSVDGVFDIAAVLGQAAPDDHLIQEAFMSPHQDPHPNGAAGTAVAEAFLAWYGQIGSESIA